METKAGQGAIESSLLRSSTAGTLVGQGATEYLVLLAVVLIVALVSVALLGFFPGMASDAQMTQSKTYWQSAQPIAIIDSSLGYFEASTQWGAQNKTGVTFRIRNNGAYPVTLSKILGGNTSISQYHDPVLGTLPLSNFKLAPGEELCFGNTLPPLATGCTTRSVLFIPAPYQSGAWGNVLQFATSACTAAGGMLVVDNFGFEYVETIDGQQITKRETGGKPWIVQCNRA